jgi:hypothetical protein
MATKKKTVKFEMSRTDIKNRVNDIIDEAITLQDSVNSTSPNDMNDSLDSLVDMLSELRDELNTKL